MKVKITKIHKTKNIIIKNYIFLSNCIEKIYTVIVTYTNTK